MATGIVKVFKADKGYGFIKPDDGGDDMFVHIKDVKGMQPLSAGMRVGFDETIDAQRKTRATNVRLL